MVRILLLALCLLIGQDAYGRNLRLYSAKADFVRLHPCPSSGSHNGKACPGYVIDRIHPLCNGGPDRASKLQWQTVHDVRRSRIDGNGAFAASGSCAAKILMAGN